MKKIFYLLLLFFIANQSRAQSGFDKIYSFSPYPAFDVFSGITSIYADTQQILVAGNTFRDTIDNNPFTGSAAFLASYDYAGNVAWKKRLVFSSPVYKSSITYYFNSLKKMRPNKYVFLGCSWDNTVPGSFTTKSFIYFFNANGDSLKFVPIPFGNNVEYNHNGAICLDKRSDIITTGTYANKVNPDTVGIWIAKFDSAGNFKWRKVIVDTPLYATGAKAFKVIEGNNSSYLFAGQGATPDTAHYSGYAIWKTDTAGNVLWRKQLPKTPGWNYNQFYAEDTYFDIIRASNGSGYYFMATCPKPVQYPGEPVSARMIYYCGKLNENGNMVWTKRYDRDSLHYESSYGLEQKVNGDLLFIGKSSGLGTQANTPSSGASQFCTDSIGNVKWFKITKRYNCPFDVGHILSSIKVAPNGNIVRGGYNQQLNKQPGCYDTAHAIAWLVMTDSMGRKNNTDTITYPVTIDTLHIPVDTGDTDTGLVIHLIPDDEKPYLNLYPNPAMDVIHLSLHNFNAQPSQLSVQVFDYTGKMILQKKMEHLEDAINISAYPAGIYLIKLRYKDKDVGTEKFVKQ